MIKKIKQIFMVLITILTLFVMAKPVQAGTVTRS